MNSTVSLVRVQNSEINQGISKALDLADYKFPAKAESVVIKPNLCYYWDAATGNTTDPRVVAAIIDRVREEYGRDVKIRVAEADASAMRTKYAFKMLGYEKLAQEKKIELFNLSEGGLEEKSASVGSRQMEFKVSPLLLNSDLLINVPKPKLMRVVKITCAMKNMFGAIGTPRKVVYHKFLNEAVVGINKILRPHLTIVDGLVGSGRYTRKLNLLMASADSFSIDWVAAQVMGHKPSGVKFLRLSIAERLGDPKEVVSVGEPISEFAEIFPKERLVSTNFLWSSQFLLLKIYKKLSGDIIPPVFQE
jgi:uncharacterized protein (DUF362 family)